MPFAQQDERALDQLERLLRLLVLAAHPSLEHRHALLQAVEIGEHQLGLDGLGVGDRIDAALDMDDVVILEAAEHIGDGVDLADHGEELIAEAFALGGAAHEAGDVDEGEPRRDDLGGLGDLGERIEARIGHRHLADIRLDGAEGIIGGRGGRGLGQRVEEGGLADIGQSDDAAFEAHATATITCCCHRPVDRRSSNHWQFAPQYWMPAFAA